jgi:hypothetical protein
MPEAQAQREAQARVAAKRAAEARANEHTAWSAVAQQMEQMAQPAPARQHKNIERQPSKQRPPQQQHQQPQQPPPQHSNGGALEKQQALVKACLRARARPLTHTAPPTNLAELHRQICDKAACAPDGKQEKQEGEPIGELTPRFPPRTVYDETRGELPRILGRMNPTAPPGTTLSPKAEDNLGIDLKFLDEESPAHGQHHETPPQGFDAMSALFSLPTNDFTGPRPCPVAPPQPRFLQARP